MSNILNIIAVIVVVIVVFVVVCIVVVVIVIDGPRNLLLKFTQNRVSNNKDIANIEFVVGGVGWAKCKVIFVLNPT